MSRTPFLGEMDRAMVLAFARGEELAQLAEELDREARVSK